MDTSGVARSVDSLVQVSRALMATGDYDQALGIIDVAEKLALEKLGQGLFWSNRPESFFNSRRIKKTGANPGRSRMTPVVFSLIGSIPLGL